MLFILLLFSLLIYMKILNIENLSAIKCIAGIIFSGVLACVFLALSTTVPYSRFFIMVLAMGAFAGIISKKRFGLALIASMISIGISCGFFLGFLLISALIQLRLFQYINVVVMMIMSFSMQFVLISLLFRIKRFRKGMLFLQKKEPGIIGFIVSGIIFVTTILIRNINFAARLRWQFLIGGILCVALLIFWWRKRLTKLYQKWIRERKQQEYEVIIAEKDKQIQALQKSNESMASLIHRDNKMLPAMYQTMKILHNEEFSDIEFPMRSRHALAQIGEYMEERTAVIMRDQRENTTLPSTGDPMIDGLMKYMLLKATGNEIGFDLNVVEDISELAETIISATKFKTLCADLIENAIIATSHSTHKKILITIGTCEGFYELNIQDSGIPFEIDTLMSLGIRKASTHLDEGGSGIGYMTIFEILHEYSASLLITEYEPRQYGFTKSVKIRFDNRNEYFLHTFRAKQLIEVQNNLDEQTKGPTILSI